MIADPVFIHWLAQRRNTLSALSGEISPLKIVLLNHNECVDAYKLTTVVVDFLCA